MTILISASSGDGQDAAISGMFAARKQVFIDLLKWDLPTIGGQYEIDRFDDLHAHYLILTDALGNHFGSARLLPTERPHILDTLFADLCDGPAPRGERIYEITRFCLDRRLRAAERRRVRDQLVSAIAGHALEQGISDYVGVAEQAWLAQVLRFGWDCAPLGPVAGDRRSPGAFRIRIDAATPSLLAATGMWSPVERAFNPAQRTRARRCA